MIPFHRIRREKAIKSAELDYGLSRKLKIERCRVSNTERFWLFKSIPNFGKMERKS